MLGLSKEKGIDLLLEHSGNSNFCSNTLFGKTPRKDIINLILDDLEITSGKTFKRTEECLSANIC